MERSLADELAQTIARAEQIGAGHLVPLLRAARAGAINLAFVGRGTAAPMGRLKRSTRPMVLLVGDDDGAPTGPAGWPQAGTLLHWCSAAVVHSAGAEPRHYEAALAGALVHGRILLIETDSAREAEWLALVRRLRPGLPGLIVRVRLDAPAHPLLTAPAGTTIQ